MPPRASPPPRDLFTWFAWLSTAAALVLICIGGLVTSHGAGMSVPDWPNTYGYNLFFFPISKWVGGIFYEHTHRLFASGVGLLTTVLAVWLWRRERLSPVRWLGVAAFFGVVGQGVLGGLRVTLLKDEIGIVHATVAQLFLVLLAVIATVTSRAWRQAVPGRPVSPGLRAWLAFATGLILGQLILGAMMRHQHAGLAIPDFPLAYGHWWPRTDAEAILGYNQARVEVHASSPITAFGVVLQMAHRLGALTILVTVAVACVRTWRERGPRCGLTRVAGAWLGLIVGQVGLGAATIWTGKSADIATAHVAVGATILVLGSMLVLWSHRAHFPFAAPKSSGKPTV